LLFNMKRRRVLVAVVFPVVSLGWACAPSRAVVQPAPAAVQSAAGEKSPTKELRWVRGSAEFRAIEIQTYRAALEAATRASAGRPAGSWAVAVDADETIIDNSGYEAGLQRQGAVHTDAAWRAWVKGHERVALPGAKEFLSGVRQLGGRIAVVSNTEQALCADLATDLDRLGLPYDVLLCSRGPEEERKEERWRSIEEGTARPDLGKLEILVWVGDNIQDFPGKSQSLRELGVEGFADFGVRYFALPNPIYGSWEKNANR